ncbi:MAG: hypothetical protein OXG72_14900 [Acidobacteria bacterium]|nr:hypothetical protein [Acidobacteriota bacterium]
MRPVAHGAAGRQLPGEVRWVHRNEERNRGVTDIGERVNVAAEHPEVVEWLRALADEARADLGDYDRIGSGVRFFEDGPRWPRRVAWHGQR